MGEMSYGSPSRGSSSSYPYSRPSLVEEITSGPFANANVRGIEEDLALIRQGERAQLLHASDEGNFLPHEVFCLVFAGLS